MKIHLAVDIAETVLRARRRRENVDVATLASELVARHPEAGLTEEHVAEVLAFELLYPAPPSAGARSMISAS